MRSGGSCVPRFASGGRPAQDDQFVSDAARMARALQPALVVLEDCDLVAENRDFGRSLFGSADHD